MRLLMRDSNLDGNSQCRLDQRRDLDPLFYIFFSCLLLIVMIPYLYCLSEGSPLAIQEVGKTISKAKPVAQVAKVVRKRSFKKRVAAKKRSQRIFTGVLPSFAKIDFRRVTSLKEKELKSKILSSVPKSMRISAKRYISLVWDLAEKHQIDPFWVLSIMWTESHFRKRARSPAGARGLMQLMPVTKRYIKRIARRQGLRLGRNHNVEIGIIYLKRLLKKFDNNFVHATVAYNMGPTRIDRWLKRKKPVGKRNRYLRRVKKAYRRLTRNFDRITTT